MRKTLFIYLPAPQQEPAGWLLRGADNQAETLQPGWPEAKHARNNRVVVLVGAEHCLCMPAQFPGRKNLNAWRKAAPWVLEDEIAEDTSQLHFAIAPQANADGQYLVAAIRSQVMADLLSTLADKQLQAESVIPDVCLLPPGNADAPTTAIIGERCLLQDNKGAYALDSTTATSVLPEDHQHWLHCETDLAAIDSLSSQWNANTSLNMRQGEMAPGEAMAARLRPWRSAAIAAVIAGVIWSVTTGFTLQQLQRENQNLQQEMSAVFQSALPGAKMVKPELQMRQALNSGGSSSDASFLKMLDAATAPLITISDAKITSLDHRSNTLVLNLSATKIATVEQIKQAMNRLQAFQAEVGSVRADADDVQLRITITPEA